MTIGTICTRNVTTVSKRATVISAAQCMRQAHVGDVVVVESRDGRDVPVGILTDRDIALCVVANNAQYLPSMVVNDVMSDNLVLVNEDATVDTALGLMRDHGVRRLPVVDRAGGLVGVLSLDDILQRGAASQAELVALVAQAQRHERNYRG